jgi:hypothetical protein
MGHHILSEYTVFKSVPYAHLAYSASKIGGKSASDFVQVNPNVTGYQSRVDALVSDSGNAVMSQVLNGTYSAASAGSFATTPTGCPSGQYAIAIAANGNLTCATPAGGGGGSGTVTSVTSTNTDIGVASGTTTPALTLNSGTGANQILKLDGTAKIPAVDGSQITNLNPANLSSAVPLNKGGTGATTQAGAATAILPAQTGNAGKYLTTDGAGNITWAAASGSGTVTSVVAGSGLTGGTITTSGTLAVDSTTTGAANKIMALDGSG